MGDLGEVLDVEQAHLQRPVVGGEFGDRRARSAVIHPNPAPVSLSFDRLDARAGDHPAITHQHQLGQPKPGSDDVDDLGEGERVGGVAGNTRTATGRPAASVSTP
ncbi:hypothetical protein MBOT_36520 [Mycobacterium botniense]|uniref:Uncharacterized protein n=1 Tax=Mycobacterium botniense TaxID=84962 RepID=A0A7I9Y2T3_9MYCO|nr:hypothetical protein [Mycobacterium botniense]GFG76287.1 hypothetical protein MBOT_36520 [Mycobacterium botniense]